MSVERAKNVPPFVLWCTAMIPTAFDDSMSYYEALCALYKFVQDNIIDVVNNNADVLDKSVKEIEALSEYVKHYFDNLDVQEEINNKLDEMAEGGQLAGIIAQFLELAPVFGYNTISDMANADNLSNGCIAKVLGNSTAAAGDGAYYMIRTKTGADDPDGVNLVAIGDTLVGVRVRDAAIESLKTRVSNLEIAANRKFVFVGDSYGTGQNELQEQTTPWTTLVPQYLGLTVGTNCWTDSHNGSGFNNGYTFIAQLHDLADTVPDTNEITDVVIIGGYNDRYYTKDVIDGKMAECFAYAKTAFPNAQIMLACVGWSKVYDVRQEIAQRVIPAYQRCGKYGVKYLLNTEYILHDYSLFSGDHYHPNQNGQNELSAYLATAILNGGCTIDRWFSNAAEKLNEADTLNPSYCVEIQHNDQITVCFNVGYMVRSTATTLGSGTVVPLFVLKDSGLVMGTGINFFTSYTEVFVATAGGTGQAEVRGWLSPQYDSTNHRCVVNFITDKRTTTNADIAAYNTSQVQLNLHALYV